MKQSHSGTRDVSPYDFLQNLLTRFCVFVPIELQEKTTTKFDDKEYKNHDTTSKSFFLPSLLEDKEPDSNFFRYKQRNTQVWKRTLCHSWLHNDKVVCRHRQLAFSKPATICVTDVVIRHRNSNPGHQLNFIDCLL